MPTPEPSATVVVTMRDIYDKVVSIESTVAILANNEIHSEAWRREADEDLHALKKGLNSSVSRREMYSVLTTAAALIAAMTPFMARLYGGV